MVGRERKGTREGYRMYRAEDRKPAMNVAWPGIPADGTEQTGPEYVAAQPTFGAEAMKPDRAVRLHQTASADR